MHKFFTDIFPKGFLGIGSNTVAIALILIVVVVSTLLAVHGFRLLLVSACKRIKLHKYENQMQILQNHHVFKRASSLIAPVCLLFFMSYIFPNSTSLSTLYEITIKGILLYFYVVVWSFLIAVLSAINDIISMRNRKSIRGFTQIIQLLVSVVIFILVVSMLLDKSPVNILAGLGASAAVMMFVFKDTLLGFVASVQLTVNDMLQVGDWITMPQYGADGVVIEIGLTAVKVSNWDNTITNVPTYSLVSDAYQNWRGMSDSGGRRVKRSISIDMQSVKFCDNSMLERFSKVELISEFISKKIEEQTEFSKKFNVNTNVLLNGLPLTNLAVFREYLEQYLRHNHNVNLNMTHFVRQLQPTEKGVPIELYFFTTTQWIPYENVQSDVFDHIIASVREFDLRIFQDESDARNDD